MLVLVAGATGNIGQKRLASLLRRGHQVRALARSPPRPSPPPPPASSSASCRAPRTTTSPPSTPPARARVFVAASWNADWRRQALGDHESYDAYHCVRRLAALSCTLRPHYVLSGILAEVLFSAPGRVSFAPENHGVWDAEGRRVEVWGDPACRWQWTSEADAAEFAAAIVEREDAAEGGFWTVCSGYDTLEDIARVYGQVRGTTVEVERVGSVEELREKALAGRARSHPTTMWDYIGYFYVLFIVDGTWRPGPFDNEKLGVKGTSLEEYLKQNPDI